MPGTGKTTLARQLAQRYGVVLIGEDTIKESLLDTLGVGDAAYSRRLSDASFAVIFALARELAAARIDVILEGNFRAGEHEIPVRNLLPARTAQILCRIDEATRLMRLVARNHDSLRHAGHRDAEQAATPNQSISGFLDLSGDRFICEGGTDTCDR